MKPNTKIILLTQMVIVAYYSFFADMSQLFKQTKTLNLIFFAIPLSVILGFSLLPPFSTKKYQQNLILSLVLVAISIQVYPILNFGLQCIFQVQDGYTIYFGFKLLQQTYNAALCVILIFKSLNTPKVSKFKNFNQSKGFVNLFLLTLVILFMYTLNKSLCSIVLRFRYRYYIDNGITIQIFTFASITTLTANIVKTNVDNASIKLTFSSVQKLTTILCNFFVLVYFIVSFGQNSNNSENLSNSIIGLVLSISSSIVTSYIFRNRHSEISHYILGAGIFASYQLYFQKTVGLTISYGIASSIVTAMYSLLLNQCQLVSRSIGSNPLSGIMFTNAFISILSRIRTNFTGDVVIFSITLASAFITGLFLGVCLRFEVFYWTGRLEDNHTHVQNTQVQEQQLSEQQILHQN